jgi:hypothetical protein
MTFAGCPLLLDLVFALVGLAALVRPRLLLALPVLLTPDRKLETGVAGSGERQGGW